MMPKSTSQGQGMGWRRMYHQLLLAITLLLTVIDGLSNQQHSLSNKKVCIIGGGPCGLFFANHLLRQDPTVQVCVIEKAPRDGNPDLNAFGFGVGGRLKRCMDDSEIPGLVDQVDAVSAPTSFPGLRIIRRLDLCSLLRSCLEGQYGSDRFECLYETKVLRVELDAQQLQVESTLKQEAEDNNSKTKSVIKYDLLVGADGINSSVRRMLVDRDILKEEHYINGPVKWKALRLPPQSDLGPTAFQPLAHPDNLLSGAVLPRYPEGHTMLVFWTDGNDNPGGIDAVQELCQEISSAVQGKIPKKNLYRRLTWGKRGSEVKENIKIEFDEKDVERFLNCRPGREHYMKLDKYHYHAYNDTSSPAVALIGDAAHGMYSYLGQGCACGFESSLRLSKCLAAHSSIRSALEAYSQEAVPEGHAISDLNLIAHTVSTSTRGGFAKFVSMSQLLLNGRKGKILVGRVNANIKYQELLKENRLAIAMSRRLWKTRRQAVEHKRPFN
mmetsp:Transcript_9926/g.22284  ORF Transcript_9926/g.22284 Transcript_9926/m.22284 type:complete len:497 (+) Transcript_9926:35-1525(+)